MITIINYGSGNIRAIGNIYDTLNISYRLAENVEDVSSADKIILPGVGAFDETINKLKSNGFQKILEHKVLIDKTPILGICVGMQMLANSSEEGKLTGLGWINGTVKRFDKNLIFEKPKLPHLGWNSIKILKKTPLLENIDEDEGFYFIHSYYYDCADKSDVLATTEYGIVFDCAINRENIFGVQFHPEKSHGNGITVLRNFANL